MYFIRFVVNFNKRVRKFFLQLWKKDYPSED